MENAYKYRLKNVLLMFVFVLGFMVFLQTSTVLASNAVTFSQSISDGILSVDIVDGSGNSVSSPSGTFNGATFSFSNQTATGTLGTSSQKIRSYNPTGTATWTTSIAATGGPTALWTSGSNTYSFNDSTAGVQLTVNPSAGTVAGVPDNTTCSPTSGITKGSSSTFQALAPAVSSITLLTASSLATPYCRWDLTGVSLSQVIPASQPTGTYTLGFTITIA